MRPMLWSCLEILLRYILIISLCSHNSLRSRYSWLNSTAGDKLKSSPNSGSGHSFLSNNSNVNSGRSNKKRPYASSRHSWSGLEPVAEENSWQQPDLNFKLARLSENGLTPENNLLVESNQSLIRLSSKKNLQSTH